MSTPGFPITRLRYTKSTGLCTIYWRDRQLKFHEYKRKRTSNSVQALLDRIETRSDHVFQDQLAMTNNSRNPA